ncbi:peptidoglycan DD-metalloendopeptidase family protein [Nonomuraea sp. LP-02]|uniref:M23 family metallopeptidase n=1 Tax=Nonomuraea sp. LP-02 TaxID=3097960 RepID=UPI002E356A8B|nr:peptidoglycan DD-metalloendopeptidase family protein [Nonomuraea sp. LP-02]MED7926769.1 peptidoglycan DD-metalloendopeptidase family protein [Nonomuraea sp. LP-02]
MHSHSTSNQASVLRRRPTPNETRPPRFHHIAAFLLLLLPTTLVAPLLATTLIVLTAPPARASPPAWRWPLDGHPRVLRRFTPPPERWLAGHRGVDLAAPPSTPVLAAGAGTVRFAGPVGGKGVVTIDHEGGLRTTYLPVTPAVKRNQLVTPGTELGLLQTPNPHCPESCLHWGLLRDSRYLNPLLLLGQAPIRLLPFWPAPPQAITFSKKPRSTTAPRPPTRFRTRGKTDHPNPPPPKTTGPDNYRLSNSTSPTTATPIAISLPVAILTALLLIIGLHHRRHHGRTSDSRPPRPNSGRHRKRHSGTHGIRANSKHRKGARSHDDHPRHLRP